MLPLNVASCYSPDYGGGLQDDGICAQDTRFGVKRMSIAAASYRARLLRGLGRFVMDPLRKDRAHTAHASRRTHVPRVSGLLLRIYAY